MKLICGHWEFNGAAGSAFPALPSASNEGFQAETDIFCDAGLQLTTRDDSALHVESSPRKGPGSKPSFVIAWDGRLDNRSELIRETGIVSASNIADIEVVAAAYRRWSTDSFPKLKGDWALTIWDADSQSLILAKDPMGMRPLFFARNPHGIKWSNSIQWIVRNSNTGEINLEYVAGWFSFFPAADLTPYCSISAVPPSSFVRFHLNRLETHKFWEFQPPQPLQLADDYEYEERFRKEFANSVRRRIRTVKPILAELSGGVDSTSIVCVADALLAHEEGLAPRLDTLSFYDDNEPNWNERPFFELVEAKRGNAGRHLKVDSTQDLGFLLASSKDLACVPAEVTKTSGYRTELSTWMRSRDYAAILSGIGGDEFTGGVPTAIPELADLLVTFRFRSLARQLKSWSLAQRRPWIHVLLETFRTFVSPARSSGSQTRRPPAWLSAQFRQRYHTVLLGYEKRLTVWGSLPSFQENLSVVEALRRQIAASSVDSEGIPSKSYPYLDTDFLQFLFSVPREQLIQPGRRRSLMRRALAGIVPDEILNRKRKAYVLRSPIIAIGACWPELQAFTRNMISEQLGIVSSRMFLEALDQVRKGHEMAILPVYRLLLIECWLRNLVEHNVLAFDAGSGGRWDDPPLRLSRAIPERGFQQAEKFKWEGGD